MTDEELAVKGRDLIKQLEEILQELHKRGYNASFVTDSRPLELYIHKVVRL